ncbi:translation initiation factor IF-2 [Streptomyces sp. SID10815]|nr:translation initiation factor IF-2 [Streptomyces sp. SID10815]
MAGKGSGGGTSFEGMSHEQMLAWLDQASSGEVQAAAGRLATAATEIQRIAEQLKLRPQVVEWKGEGADAFRSWANELANSSLRLADFSKAAGVQLGHASDAIATAQASIPRDTKGAQANLDAATVAHNDPDSAAIRAKSASELAALKADREKVRQEAADQMRKLAQSYQVSTTQMNGLARPKFPPPPKTIAPPPSEHGRDSSGYVARPGGSGSGSGGGGQAAPSAVATHAPRVTSHGGSSHQSVAEVQPAGSPPHGHGLPERTSSIPERNDHVGIDSVGTVPDAARPHADPTVGLPGGGRSDATAPTPQGTAPPLLRDTGRFPVAKGRSAPVETMPVGSSRTVSRPGGGPEGRGVTQTGPGRSTPVGRAPLPGQATSAQPGPTTARPGAGVTGGRPTTPSTGRPSGGLPRGTVMGAEGTPTGGRGQSAMGGGPMRQTPGGPGQQPRGGRGSLPGYGNVVGRDPQQAGSGAARRSPTGALGGPTQTGAPVRGGVAGGRPVAAAAGAGAAEGRGGRVSRPAGTAQSSRANGAKRRSERRREDEDKDESQRHRRGTPRTTD